MVNLRQICEKSILPRLENLLKKTRLWDHWNLIKILQDLVPFITSFYITLFSYIPLYSVSLIHWWQGLMSWHTVLIHAITRHTNTNPISMNTCRQFENGNNGRKWERMLQTKEADPWLFSGGGCTI